MLKKMIVFSAVVTMLTACSNTEATKKNEATNEDATQETQVNQQENEQPAENVQASIVNRSDREWASLPEYNKIMEQIDNKDIHFEQVTDTNDKRILYVIDENGTKQYKTIFIKNTNRLKIIQIKDDGQIFNDVLS